MPALDIELVPSTAWGSNLRTLLTPREWSVCRRWAIQNSAYSPRCTVCGGAGVGGRVECHETWHYDDVANVQTLAGLVALCPDCHHCKHLGYLMVTQSDVMFDKAVRHLMAVNGWDIHEAEDFIEAAFALHAVRSQKPWALDIRWLQRVLGDQLPDLSSRLLVVTAAERRQMATDRN